MSTSLVNESSDFALGLTPSIRCKTDVLHARRVRCRRGMGLYGWSKADEEFLCLHNLPALHLRGGSALPHPVTAATSGSSSYSRRASEEEVQALGADVAKGDGLGTRGGLSPKLGHETNPPASAAAAISTARALENNNLGLRDFIHEGDRPSP